jgi:Ca-activated chloride channel homolog
LRGVLSHRQAATHFLFIFNPRAESLHSGERTLKFQLRHLPMALALAFAGVPFVLAIAPGIVAAQDLMRQSPVSVAQQPLQVTTEIVKLDATVTDERGEFIGGLQQKDFRILDRGVEQPILFFAPTDAPAQILVMIETSPAVYLIQSDHIAALYSLARGLAPDDEVALVTYNDAPRTILPFTQDKASLTAVLEQIQYTLGFGDLNLFDSISAVLDSLAPATGKKAVLLLTTGLDSSPPSHWDALVRKLRSSDVVIFPVALGTVLRAPAKKNKSKLPAASGEPSVFAAADKTLRSLADLTGGRAFFPESPGDFASIYRVIGAALRHQYLLGIAPVRDGQFHPLTVQALDENGVPYPASGRNPSRKILVREGYLVPAP